MTADARRPRELAPASALPLWYFGLAHLALASALVVLIVDPAMPARVFYQPKVIALVHCLTVGWLTASILGAIYIAGPLALGVPMRVGVADWTAFASLAIGLSGMVSHFWMASYDGMAWSAFMVVAAVAFVGVRAARGARRAAVSAAVWLHLGLAFLNFLMAATFGMLIGVDRSRGILGVSSIAAVYAHAQLAAIGWVLLMVIGMSYRLLPMMLPAAIPTGRTLYVSAIAIEAGLGVVFVALLRGVGSLLIGALLIVAGIASFVAQVRRILKTKKPRPPALPVRDWSTWQTHGAFAWLIVTAACGVALCVDAYGDWRVTVAWVYGTGGLVGFLGQMVSGVQGRIVPWYAWYRARALRQGAIPDTAANALPSATHARVVFVCWTAGVPLLAAGLATSVAPLTRAGALLMLMGVAAGAAHIRHMMRRALGYRTNDPNPAHIAFASDSNVSRPSAR